MHDALHAGLIAAAVSGAPSTVIALARGDDVLESGRAAGSLLLPHETRTLPLLAAATPLHVAISVGWAFVLERAIPRGRERVGGVAGGLAIAALDLGVIGRRLPRIRALPQPRQWADHVAYGLTVGLVLERRRRRSALRLEAERAASDPNDLAEARRIRAEMDQLAVDWHDS